MTLAAAMPKDPVVAPHALSTPEDLGVFGSIALLAVLQAGGDAGFRRLSAHAGFGQRLAPHRALRHQILMTLLKSGVLAPGSSKQRMDDAIRESAWEEDSLEDADWMIVWDELTRSSLPQRIRLYLDTFESTPRTREVLLDTWQASAIGECLAFGEYALAAHNLNPAIARAAAPALQPILAQQSIGQGCALMWSAAKNVAAWFLRHGGGSPGSAERELTKSIQSYFDRASFNAKPITQFSRHTAVPQSAFATVFMWASRLGDDYWNIPVSEIALDRMRPLSQAVERDD